MKKNRVPILSSLGLIVALLAALFVGPAAPATANRNFPETGQNIWGSFEAYWTTNGGLAQFGLPRTSVYPAGEKYDAQWFERALLTYTPSNPDPFKVQLQLLGYQSVAGRLSETPFKGAQKANDASFFTETGHNLAGKFLEYWNATGGLAIYGFPVSEEFMEKSASDGKMYRVQYFERNRFELHPENAATPFEVQLGLLGSEMLDAAGGPDAIAKLGAPKFYPSQVIEVPGQVVTPVGGSEPGPTAVPVPDAPALPATTRRVLYQADFATDSLTDWRALAGLGPADAASASWSVRDGMLRQSGIAAEEDAADETVLLLQNRDQPDFNLDVFYYATSGDAVGAVFRYSDGGFYLLQLYGQVPNDKPKAVLTRFAPGSGKVVAQSTTWPGYTGGSWQRLTITAQGENFTVAVDGQEIMRGSDSFFKSGPLGLYAFADGTARFDNLRITAP